MPKKVETHSQQLIWMDLEMTGLDPETNRILEMATLITDSSLHLVAEGPVFYIKQSEPLLAGMDKWNTEHHTSSGLIEFVRTKGVSETAAELATLEFLAGHAEAGTAPLCGNSISHDRRFLAKYMPQLEAFLHYRNIDVSSIKELALRWRPDIASGLVKKNTHRALEDIQESIEELRHYRQHFFRHSMPERPE